MKRKNITTRVVVVFLGAKQQVVQIKKGGIS